MYQNPYTPGFEVLRKTGYNIGSHGDISSQATYLINNDFPDYAAMFYHPSEHEMIASIKYGNMDVGYDKEARAIKESFEGLPLEFYIPQSMHVDEGAGRQDAKVISEDDFKKLANKINKEAIDEIARAQKEVSGKSITLREMEIEESLTLRRRIRKREIILKDKEKDT